MRSDAAEFASLRALGVLFLSSPRLSPLKGSKAGGLGRGWWFSLSGLGQQHGRDLLGFGRREVRKISLWCFPSPLSQDNRRR